MQNKNTFGRLVISLFISSLVLAGCHGSASYVPTSSSQNVAPSDRAGAGISPDSDLIRSNCASLINLKIAGVVHCRFWETHHANAYFTLRVLRGGVITVTPLQGDRRTDFVVTALLTGRDVIDVRDRTSHRLRIKVHVNHLLGGGPITL